MHDVILTVDPGRSGAATALSRTRGPRGQGIVLAAIEWTSGVKKGYHVFKVDAGPDLGGEHEFGCTVDLIRWIMMWWLPRAMELAGHKWGGLIAVGVEGMVIDKRKKGQKGHKSEKSQITLFEETGAVVDGFRALGVHVDYRPTAVVWRGRVLKLGAYTKRAAAEAYAMAMVDRLFVEGHGLTSIHMVECGCIGLYCREAVITGDL